MAWDVSALSCDEVTKTTFDFGIKNAIPLFQKTLFDLSCVITCNTLILEKRRIYENIIAQKGSQTWKTASHIAIVSWKCH